MVRSKNIPFHKRPENSFSLEIGFLSSDSSGVLHSHLLTQETLPQKKKTLKNSHTGPPKPLGKDEVHKFRDTSSKAKFETFKKCSVVLGHVVNLEQLEDCYCKVSIYLRVQELSLLLD